MSQPKIKLAPRCATGISGLDEILNGGLPSHRLFLFKGEPGVGKTTLALQFLMEGIRLGESSLYITLSETKEELDEVATSHEWNIEKIHLFELSALEERLKGEEETTFFHPSEVELNRTTQLLLEKIEEVKPDRLVFDSLSEMRLLAETPLRYRRQVLRLKQFFAGRKITVLFLDDRTGSAVEDLQVESIAHGVVCLQRTAPEYGVSRRQLNVLKIRGSKFSDGFHDFNIEQGGVVVYPRLIASGHHRDFKRESVSSGIPEIDSLMGGGLDRGTASMFMGPPGTGKSTLAAKFACVSADRGENVLFFIFDETIGTFINRTTQLGFNILPHIESGLICVEQIDPAEITPGELGHRIRQAVLNKKARMIVIDSINGYMNSMPGERSLTLQLHELLSFLNQQGILTIMVLAQQGLVGQMQSSVDLTYLADTVVLFRYFEARGSVKQALSIIKKRSGNHERTIREVAIAKGGFIVGKPLTNMHGVLTGVPVVDREDREPNLTMPALVANVPAAPDSNGEAADRNASDMERRVLLLAPTANDARMTTEFLRRSGIPVESCRSVAELCREMDHGCGSLVLAEEALGAASIALLLKTLAGQPSWSDIPVIILISREASSDDRLRRLKMFGLPSPAMLIERPIHPATLVSAVEVAMRSRDRQYQVRNLLEESRAASERLEKAVADRTAQLRATIGELEAFSYSVSHDLRSPLRAMQGYAETLMDEHSGSLDETAADYLTRIRRGAARMDLLIQDVLAYSRVAKGEIHLQKVSMENVIADVIQHYPTLHKDCVDITIHSPLPAVLGHEAYLTQIVSNLLTNAVKFMGEGVRPRIEIDAQDEGEMVRLNFKDNGIGIASEHCKRVFQMFGRVYADKKFEGTGIGLAIAQKAAERMNGSIGVESEPGRGSRFFVVLKRAD